MKVAVIGYGSQAQLHANIYTEMPGIELVGLYVPESVDFNYNNSTSITVYDSFEELIFEENPNAISICLPTYLNKKYILKAAKLGIHVICESPMTTSLLDAKEVIEECETQGVSLFATHKNRFSPHYNDVRNRVGKNEIGSVGIIHTKRVDKNPNTKSAKIGNIIGNLIYNDIDFLESICGKVRNVYAMETSSPGIEYALVTLKFENEVIANLEGLWGNPRESEELIEIAGKTGEIRFNSRNVSSIRVEKFDNATTLEKPEWNSPLILEPYYLQLENFINYIESNSKHLLDINNYYNVLKISLAAQESAKTGLPVNLKEFGKKQ